MADSTQFPKTDFDDHLYAADVHMMFGVYVGFEQMILLVTNSDTTSSFSNNAQYLFIHNSGNNTAYLNFDAAATTNSFPLEAGARITLTGITRSPHAICATGLTTTLRILAVGTSTLATSMTVGALSVTDSSQTYLVPAGSYHYVLKNSGFNDVHINFNAAATTNHFIIGAGDTLKISVEGLTDIRAVCNSSKTSTLNIISTSRW